MKKIRVLLAIKLTVITLFQAIKMQSRIFPPLKYYLQIWFKSKKATRSVLFNPKQIRSTHQMKKIQNRLSNMAMIIVRWVSAEEGTTKCNYR